MTHLNRLLFTLAIIFFSLLAGWLFRVAAEKYRLADIERRLPAIRRRLQTTAIFFLLPLAAVLSLWGLPHPSPELLLLPLLGLCAYIWGGFLGIASSRLLGLNPRQTGSFFCCGTFTNIGAVGGLVCLLFLGENSIAMVALYRLLEEIYYFSIAFPIAKWYGATSQTRYPSLRQFKLNPSLAVIVSALFLGIMMNLAKIPRPAACGMAASWSMIIATIFFLFTIGLTLRISRLGRDIKPALAMTAIKFLGIPLLVTPLAIFLDFGSIEGGLPLKSVFVLCSMPVAMTALIPPSLFSLDVDLANACWIYSTLGLVIWLPLLPLLLTMF